MVRFARILRNLPELSLGIFVIAVSLVVFIQIIFRYFLNYSLGWTDELAKILFVWISLLGAAVCVKRAQHYSFPVLSSRLGRRGNSLLHILVTLLVITFCIFFTWYGYKSFLQSFKQSLIVMQISWAWVFVVVPISGILMCNYSIPFLVKHMKTLLSPLESPPSSSQSLSH
jgi:TRAP-type C4-dicarboxylate transport system permease small subunit